MSYLSYYNMFNDFSAGAGVKDNDLFTESEEASFLPKQNDELVGTVGNTTSYPMIKGTFPNILIRNDVKSLIGLILLVLAITSTPIIAVIMLVVAAALLPFPSLVIAYCLSMQIITRGSNTNTMMSIVCVVFATLTMILNTISSIAYTISYIILAILFCLYAYNLSKDYNNSIIDFKSRLESRRDKSTNQCIGDFTSENIEMYKKPSFYES
ncbi:MV membrane protein [Cotia virus SPAn232]|uniref:MV membrane protein n=2 Tax=Cotia virus TaxID=39444 RepID=A0A097IVZ1_9POXV|nr:MV membrane protein [Cotia virus SPAn232]ADT91136.1 MV membrane protein [Cotia virus SPAn232]AIT70741.1 MV membrane protein [Cotia virus]